ncbi:MAG TPA: GNAT family N-acetyltransferase [Smithella sp.]|nr:GNAT family N-acetyltransferase [Smithella sp.]MDM7988479.1 GNAT family N-acetyltransferase [Smithella sp.]HNY50366.1 GNAT family N-acetyltransferase [Smithella sp.]HOG88963.1 GNAT family N-acetyltransferase [Smithella sp.]HOU51536.1 GNAT family N-acetyltransferase [Smithella sp.]
MDSLSSQVFLSDIDTGRFGVQTARAAQVTVDTLQSVLDFCHAHNVKLLIARCDANDLKTIQAMESNGFFLTDTLLYYQCDIHQAPKFPVLSKGLIRPVHPGEAQMVKNLAIEAFRGYVGHYHADPRLDQKQCDEAYASWAYRSCLQKDIADQVLVAEQDGSLKGFVVLKLHTPEEGQLVLNAVHPEAQSSGVYFALVSAAMLWCFQQGAKRITTSTHLPNIAVQKVWARHGFWLTHADCTFHKWFD